MMEREYILIDLERSLKTGRLFFWRENARGYTDDLAEAGAYEAGKAYAQCYGDLDGRTVAMKKEEAESLWRGMV